MFSMNYSATETSSRRPHTFIIGYGNTLRSDDGAGPATVEKISQALGAKSSCQCIVAHQLAPEHAVNLHTAQRVVFVDASKRVPAGKVHIAKVFPVRTPTRAFTHHLSPERLLWIADEYFGHAPDAWLVEIGSADLDLGTNLSPRVAGAVARLAGHLAWHFKRWSSFKSTAFANASKAESHV
jgi:hydrogenase maturation protease